MMTDHIFVLPQEKQREAYEISLRISKLKELRAKVKTCEDDISYLKWVQIHETDYDLVESLGFPDKTKVEICPDLLTKGNIREAYQEYVATGKYNSKQCVILRNILLSFQRKERTLLEKFGLKYSDKLIPEMIYYMFIKRRQLELEMIKKVEDLTGERPENSTEYVNREIEEAYAKLAALY